MQTILERKEKDQGKGNRKEGAYNYNESSMAALSKIKYSNPI